MSKAKTVADYSHVTLTMLNRAKAVVRKADDQHRYSVGEIYPVHNAVFKKNAQQETCSTCLTNRVRDLRAFIKEYEKMYPTTDQTITGNVVPPVGPGQDIGTLFTSFMEARGVTEDTPLADRPGAIMAFQEAYKDILTDEVKADIAEVLVEIERSLNAPAPTYEALSQRFSLYDADDEAAVIRDLLAVDPDDGYNLTDAEEAIMKNRLAELEARSKVDTGAAEGMDPNFPEYKAPAEGVTRYPTGADLLPIDFTPSTEDAAKGTVLYADGSKVKAGTYSTATGQEIAVQPGGKATIKEVDLT